MGTFLKNDIGIVADNREVNLVFISDLLYCIGAISDTIDLQGLQRVLMDLLGSSCAVQAAEINCRFREGKVRVITKSGHPSVTL